MSRVIVFLFTALILAMPLSAKQSLHAKKQSHPIDMMDNDTAGMAAYSDTTSFAQSDSLTNAGTYSHKMKFNINNNDSVIMLFRELVGIGILGVIIVIFVAVIVIILTISPFVFFGFLVYLIVNHQNEKRRFARMAIMSGNPVPQNIVKNFVETDDEQWRRGLKNVFLGLGIVVLCYCFGTDRLAGIGWLVMIYGAGLAVIAKTSRKNKEEKMNENNAECEKDSVEKNQ
ncbi:DUF6249 domain-containing protein [Prevotella sp. OH937_COT-195]|uniref:DUF6249 domain-containing protein n=1 Tax=Prevotella sp. OH937_COT-195 TaxID=2491051 RepID=UPI000F648AF2|nr:DUF6249 domain-containing protein [Prevotella sp. OH937_COT-195]RRC97659.1 hypothetical protein EII32_10210 [Prevotella sp. OH937_COT-195]